MLKFLFKGLIRDKSRSFFPILIVTAGVIITVFLSCWMKGMMDNMISSNARFQTGHVKIMTKEYAEIEDQKPNDLALVGVDHIFETLNEEFSDMVWTSRIHFGGLIDIPDNNGETKDQNFVIGMGLNLLSPESPEHDLMNLDKAIISGSLPNKSNQLIISSELANKMNVKPGDPLTIISNTMHGSMSIHNFIISGTVQFGIQALDRSAVFIDISEARMMLDMENASSEILGFFHNFQYDDRKASLISDKFNIKYNDSSDFSPFMIPLKKQSGLEDVINMSTSAIGIIVFVFIFVMSIVLWNSGLMNGIRRYGEIGVRLAIGESKTNIYLSMILESAIIGFLGSILGTIIGLIISYIIQHFGIDMSFMTKQTTVLISSVVRTKVTTSSYFVGFIPGFFATLIGSMLSGIGIFKRQTSQLFKELEA